jgi:hypothetical protein
VLLPGRDLATKQEGRQWGENPSQMCRERAPGEVAAEKLAKQGAAIIAARRVRKACGEATGIHVIVLPAVSQTTAETGGGNRERSLLAA